MLKLWASGRSDRSSLRYITPDAYFDFKLYDYKFLDSDFAKRVLYDCSGEIQVVNYENFLRPNGLYISPKELSSGAKNLLCMYSRGNEDGYLYDILWCGDNCNKYIAEVSNMKDIEVRSTRVYNPFKEIDNMPITIQILETGDIVTCQKDYLDIVMNSGLWDDL